MEVKSISKKQNKTAKRRRKTKKNQTQKKMIEDTKLVIKMTPEAECSLPVPFSFRSENYIKFSNISGYGIFAGKNYEKGDIVEICPFIEIDQKYLHDDNPLHQYVFSSHLGPSGDKYIIVFGNGSLFNHNDDNNTYYYHNCSGNRLLYYAAKKAIKEGEELCIHYGDAHYVKLFPDYPYQGSRV